MLDIVQLQNLAPLAIVLVPLVTGIVEVIKRATAIETNWLPLISVAVGSLVGLLVVGVSVYGAVVGVIMGLAATGLWEFGSKASK